MASTLLQIPFKTWVKVSSKSGSIYHKEGKKVVYTESETMPESCGDLTPISKSSTKGEGFSFYGIASNEFLWCCCVFGEAIITISPDEE